MKREAIETMVKEQHLSDRHACTMVGLSRDSYPNPALMSALNLRLSAKITEIAHTRRRAGHQTTDAAYWCLLPKQKIAA